MKQIFINLKRFDVPRSLGGLCPQEDPIAWIQSVITQSVHMGMGNHPGLSLVYLLPEGLIPAAVRAREALSAPANRNIAIGCQGVHWDNIGPGKNFGAFTTVLPAAAARNLGSRWAIIGHSEERRFKAQIIQAYEPGFTDQPHIRSRAATAVDSLIRAEVQNAFESGLNVLLCVGEAAEERGEGSFEEQKPRIQAVLEKQLVADLAGLTDMIADRQLVIGYEPIWAIGPGKTPPGNEYISFVSAFIQDTIRQQFGYEAVVVYGGGLKEENAAMIAGIETIGGGLVALTRFTGEIGFDVPGLYGIVEKYLA